MKRTLLLIFCVLAGIVLGGMIAGLCAGVPALAWLAYAQGISISPNFDFGVVRLNMDFYMGVNVAQIFTIGAALYVYTRIKRL